MSCACVCVCAEARARDVATSTRLARMAAQREQFLARLRTERGAAHDQRLAAFRDKLARERDQRRADRKLARIEARKQEVV